MVNFQRQINDVNEFYAGTHFWNWGFNDLVWELFLIILKPFKMWFLDMVFLKRKLKVVSDSTVCQWWFRLEKVNGSVMLSIVLYSNCDLSESNGVGDPLCTQQIWALYWQAAFAPCMGVWERVIEAQVERRAYKIISWKIKEVSCKTYSDLANRCFVPLTLLVLLLQGEQLGLPSCLKLCCEMGAHSELLFDCPEFLLHTCR